MDLKAASEQLINAMNFSVDPCDDFYEFACGRYNAEEKEDTDPIDMATEEHRLRLKSKTSQASANYSISELLDDPTPSNSTAIEKLKIFYKSCLKNGAGSTMRDLAFDLLKVDLFSLFSTFLSATRRMADSSSNHLASKEFRFHQIATGC